MSRLLRRLGPAVLFVCLLLTGCRPAPIQQDSQFTAMDTFIHLTAYGTEAPSALDRVRDDILYLESLLNVTDETSEVYAINHRQTNTVALSSDVADLLSLSLGLARETQGCFDPTVYPVVRTWGFTTGDYHRPTPTELAGLLPLVGYRNAALAGQSLTLKEGMQLDFGGIAKGWAGDRAAQSLRANGITSAILRLGGNIQTIGTKPDGTPWKVGIQDPEGGQTLATVSVADLAVVTSGSYQRHFTLDGQDYHHLIDPETGCPADSGLISVTIVGPSGARCDALSTALFVMGLDRGGQFWQEHRDFEAVFLSKDGTITITPGLEGNFTLTRDFSSRVVEVLK